MWRDRFRSVRQRERHHLAVKHRRGPPGTYDNRGNGMYAMMYARPLVGSRANPTKQRARSPDRTQAIARRKPGRFDPSPSGCRARLDEFAHGERVPAWVAGLGARRLHCRPLVEDQNYFLCVNICVCTGPVSSGVENFACESVESGENRYSTGTVPEHL